MTEAAAQTLSNTPAIARKSYIHPDVIALADGDPLSMEVNGKSGLYAAEARLLRFLEGG